MSNWILVVDDDTTNLRMASHTLSAEKMRVSCLKSGESAIQFLQENRPDLILLDILMPGMDGFETIAAIKANQALADIPVIFLTADDDSEVRGLETGATDFIRKPFVPEELLSCVRNTIERARLEAEQSRNRRYIQYGITIENGLSVAKGDMEMYLDLIKLFLKDRKRQGTMQQFIEAQNMKDYAISVHGLKGNARTLGADKLADIAYEHEMKSKAGDIEYVKANWDELIAVWNNTLEGFWEFYGASRGEEDAKYGVENDNGGEVVKLSPSDLAEVVALLDDFEMEKAIKKLKTWLGTPLERSMRERIKNVLVALEDEFDTVKAVELLKEGGN